MRLQPIKTRSTGGRIFFAGLMAVACGYAVLVLGQTQGTTEVWTVPDRAARKPNPVPAEAISIAKGKELYVQACLPCHGPAGKGDGPAGATLERNDIPVHPGNLADAKMWQQSDGAIFWKITEGKSPMPTWGEALPEDQRWAIVNYVRTLAPKPAGNVGITNSVGIATPKPEGKP